MKAAVLYEFNTPLRVEEIETDPPGRGEVLVRFAASGVCHSDLHTVLGIHKAVLPAVLGHEGAGVVEQVGEDVRSVTPGDHVIVTWLPYCGHCRFCLSGKPQLCDNLAWSDAGLMRDGTIRFHRNGERIHHYGSVSSFAERAVVPQETVIRVADRSLPLTELALMGCAVMTGVGAVLRTAGVRAGETVAVVGCGGVGLNVIQGARIAGASRIVAVDVVDEKLELARELGATDTINSRSDDPVSQIRKLLPEGVDYSFEALGRPETIETAARLAGKGSTTVLVGMAPPDTTVAIDALTMTLEERTVKGCWFGSVRPPVDYPILVDLYRRGQLRLDALVSRTCDINGINDAFERMERGEVARTVVVYD
ncbi:MAG: alcohol dehydrogenase [Gaiellales bacterium]|nr:alcohol dehydrogenase [Gaiellales bacterium]